MDFFFIFGNNPALSLAELQSFFVRKQITAKLVSLTRDGAIFSLAAPLGIEDADALGGLVKWGQVYATLPDTAVDERYPFEPLPVNEKDHKITVGTSVYGFDMKHALRMQKHASITDKKHFRNIGLSVRFVLGKDGALSSVAVAKSNALRHGFERVVLYDRSKHTVYVGKSLWVQDFVRYSKRDYGRPKRDAKRGMLPPKLAQILINLAEQPLDAMICDPYVGIGTVLQEAWLMGYTKLVGSDMDEAAIHATKRNLDWLAKTFRLSTFDIPLFETKAASLHHKLPGRPVGAVVSEMTLGQPLERYLTPQTAQQQFVKLRPDLIKAFTAFKQILKPGSVVVCTLPAYPIKGAKDCALYPFLDTIEKLGYSKKHLLDPSQVAQFGSPECTNRGTILYGRAGQYVLREVIRFVV